MDERCDRARAIVAVDRNMTANIVRCDQTRSSVFTFTKKAKTRLPIVIVMVNNVVCKELVDSRCTKSMGSQKASQLHYVFQGLLDINGLILDTLSGHLSYLRVSSWTVYNLLLACNSVPVSFKQQFVYNLEGPATVKMTSNDAKIINSLYMPTSQTVWYPVPYKSECILGTTVKNQIHKQYINQRNCKFNFKDKPHQQLEQKCPELPDNKASKGSTNTPVNDVHTEPVFFINTINPNPMYIATASNDQQNIAATRSVLISYLSSVPPPAVVEVDSHSIKILIDHSIASVLLSSEEFALCTSVDLKCNGKIRDKLCSIKDNKRCDNDFKEIYQGIATEIYVIDLKPANRYSVRCRLAIVSKDTQFFGHHSMSSEFTTEPDVPDPPEEVFVHLHNIKDGIKLTWMSTFAFKF
ncbi:hypothetical protein GJ496_001387 [Pomphorhynchus laevis]|nr:hypothetical protein GJ496_001387 [Pomphorhynchus laevis]